MVRLPDQDAEVEQRCQCPGKHGDPERVGKQDEPGQGRVVVGGIFVGKVHLGQVREGSGNRCKEVFQLADPRKVFASDAPQRQAASRSQVLGKATNLSTLLTITLKNRTGSHSQATKVKGGVSHHRS